MGSCLNHTWQTGVIYSVLCCFLFEMLVKDAGENRHKALCGHMRVETTKSASFAILALLFLRFLRCHLLDAHARRNVTGILDLKIPHLFSGGSILLDPLIQPAQYSAATCPLLSHCRLHTASCKEKSP